MICLASSLHDIGKLMISEDILKKPGKLTDEEYAIIKQHTRIGAQRRIQLIRSAVHRVYKRRPAAQQAIRKSAG